MRPRWLPWLVLVVGLATVVWTRRRRLAALLDPGTRLVAAPRLTEAPTHQNGSAATLPSMVPGDGGTCPETHPVKANPASLIYHLPHHRMYQRLANAICYVDAAAAEREGYRVSKQ